MTRVEIQVQNGTVTIVFGGASSPIVNAGTKPVGQAPAAGKVIGGDAGTEPGHSGGAPPAGSGAVVIGPIVVDAEALEAGGGNRVGGDAGTEPGHSGGNASGGSGGGVVVIGPIVIGCCGGSGTTNQTKPAQQTHLGEDD